MADLSFRMFVKASEQNNVVTYKKNETREKGKGETGKGATEQWKGTEQVD